MKKHIDDFEAPYSNRTSAKRHLLPTHFYSAAKPHKTETSPSSLQPSAATSVHVKSPEDLLAYIQCTLGFRPINSLVAVAFSQRQLSTVVRCNLPDTLQNMLRSDMPFAVSFLYYCLSEDQELQFLRTGRRLG